MIQLIKETHIDFISKRKYAFCFSGILVLLGVVAIVLTMMGHANLGVDFAGGTLIELRFDKDITTSDLRNALSSKGITDSEIQEFPKEHKFLIRLRNIEDVKGVGIDERIKGIFAQQFKDNRFIIDKVEKVGPKVGKDLKAKAFWAIFWAFVTFIIYIAFRFEFRFGVAAAIATLHDILIVFGLFWLTGRDINLLIVTSLLTLAGYSLTDTVVVFDRIRENLRIQRKESLESIINSSINEVLCRTIVTTSTVFLVLVALIIVGSQVTLDFCLCLLVGIIIGTYSSIYIASPVLIEWNRIAVKKTKLVK